MSGRRSLRSFVYVPDKDGEGSRGFGPGDPVPAWAAKLITNPKAWADPEPDPPAKAAPPPPPPPGPSPFDLFVERLRTAGATDDDVAGLDALDDAELATLAETSDEDLEALVAMVHAEDDEAGRSEMPPKGGPGSGIDAWLAYAADHQIEVPEGASRDDVIAAVEAVPAE